MLEHIEIERDGHGRNEERGKEELFVVEVRFLGALDKVGRAPVLSRLEQRLQGNSQLLCGVGGALEHISHANVWGRAGRGECDDLLGRDAVGILLNLEIGGDLLHALDKHGHIAPVGIGVLWGKGVCYLDGGQLSDEGATPFRALLVLRLGAARRQHSRAVHRRQRPKSRAPGEQAGSVVHDGSPRWGYLR